MPMHVRVHLQRMLQLQYVGRPAPELSQVTVDMTYPATATHISKARAQKRAMASAGPRNP